MELGLDGTVVNRAGQVEIDVAGRPRRSKTFARSGFEPTRHRELGSRMSSSGRSRTRYAPGSGFTIEESEAAGSTERLFPPDIATCDDCLLELRDPADRRYRYPFTNCTNCGPRATIIDDLPYDRARTSMRAFPLCAACEAEYRDPPTAASTPSRSRAPDCGPQLSYRRPGDAAPAAHRGVALTAPSPTCAPAESSP
jgi:hydrogenase maturation protein HypF